MLRLCVGVAAARRGRSSRCGAHRRRRARRWRNVHARRSACFTIGSSPVTSSFAANKRGTNIAPATTSPTTAPTAIAGTSLPVGSEP